LTRKKLKKKQRNITSEVINRIIPILIPSCTHTVWLPSKVASLITSCHHKNIVNKTIEKPEIPTKAPFGYKCIYITPPVVKVKAEKAPTKGQGLGFTIWNGWRCDEYLIVDWEFKIIIYNTLK
jgi:hypothetical protein